MNNVTKVRISKPAHEVFESFVDPARIGHFWFSSSSARWEVGKTITLRYEEYNAQGDIQILEIEADRKIGFRWGQGEEGHVVTITLNEVENASTVIEITEEGFPIQTEEQVRALIDNKEGWVYMLSCLKAYLEHGVNIRAALVK
ncbi:SRPBCC family protein [Paenibacillus cremeus]|uniref:Activator of Hsp90 ATPase homologue 1/2-like C-terminal domain-containing protein n=1 Tax=Paenibacillus cremeus TaxID=2163881 RepID=A0A559K9P9_9BACL|nr:SRPBCC family protein [Paenibacillus cremeus]TVY08855.1 hypothetical protein FPZ49_16400 [Paenibacillus cremeus]